MILFEHFAAQEDPRIERKKLYGLIDIMDLCLGQVAPNVTIVAGVPKRLTVSTASPSWHTDN
ncbi:MAG: hypothetical protein Q8N35_00250 [Methylococcaceae bacterium]|jgi:hypothetical protein|nr:hypothetical protein [Methylococcaceae bacterium]MDZ4219155.1 hypothetical protein [Methylobacter sp.]MDP2394684.1 hypothetical protein [Methylococcaceae bacterium]MDP3017993.1 hypothetical protein [Methylococcaceae bacterium]MDP3389698.1 hypothetical protein [Methylococcaceae bacterium]